MRLLIPVVPALVLACCTNFHPVVEGSLYRTGQPTGEQISTWITRYGIRTVVRLRGGGPENPEQRATAAAARAGGAVFVQLPMSAVRRPSRERLLSLWELFRYGQGPFLVHCRGGADRSGIASALFVLQTSGDLNESRQQLQFIPYLHTGLRGTHVLREVLDEYAPWQDRLPFPDWVRTVYEP